MSSPYLLIPIVLLLAILYLFCEMMVRMNLLDGSLNRKIWNSALLLTFFTTAVLGLLLAIQTNYKLEWPLVKLLLKIHVDFGIAMTFVALFHFFRHIKYYLKIFLPQDGKPGTATNHPEAVSGRSFLPYQQGTGIKLLTLFSGFLATTVQVLYIREITTVFQGNELMMSWTLGVWMLLTGAGSFWGRSRFNLENPSNLLNVALPVLAILPVLLVPAMEILKTTLFPPGLMINPAWFLLLLIVFLTPFCLLSGFIFALLVKAFQSGENGFSKVYALEAIGSMTGGLVVTFVLVQWISVFQSLLLLLLMTAILFAFISRGMRYYAAVGLILAIVLLSGILRIDSKLKSFLFVNQRIIESSETYYGNVTITENAGQYNFYGNGSLLYTTDNTITREEYTHYAMMQHRNPASVLLVSGGVAGMVGEILKYNTVLGVDYVEINPKLVEMTDSYLSLPSDGRLHIIADDGRRAIQRSIKKYDVVILAVADPASLQVNRYYTDEFLAILERKLNAGGVVLYGLSSSGNYMSPEKRGIESALYHTLKNHFNQVEIIPGERDYLIASDSTLRIDMAQLSATKKIDTKYVNPSYMDDFSIRQRGKLIRDNLAEKVINSDEKPLPVYYHTLQFIAAYTSHGWWMLAIPLIILLLPLIFMRSVAAGMYLSGFTASSFEILIIFTFQTFYGYVYSAIGLIIAIFMGGLAAGSMVANHVLATRNRFVYAQAALAFYALLFPLCWYLLKAMGSDAAGLLFIGFMTIILSSVVGFQYVVGTKILPGNYSQTAPLLYAVDLIGAALGAIVISVILLPLAGVFSSCLIIGGINLFISVIFPKRKF